jgi:acyl carrier protein
MKAVDEGSKGKSPMKDILVEAIKTSICEIAGMPAADLSESSALFGKGALLDSVGLVSLVASLEQAIEDEKGVSVSLADERAMSQRHSPFLTIGSLAEYAQTLIREGA